MSDYYVYNGHLYSASELTHFKLGWIKPNHKWITRTRSKDGKKWIYTYNKPSSQKEETNEQNIELQYDKAIKNQEEDATIEARAAQLEKNKSSNSSFIEKGKNLIKNSKLALMLKQTDSKVKADKAKQKKMSSISRINEAPRHREEIEEQNSKAQQHKATKVQEQKDRKAAMEKQMAIKRGEKKSSINDAKLKKMDTSNRTDALKSNKIDGLKIQSKYNTLADDMTDTNPNYNNRDYKYQSYHQNCSNCSVAFDLRRRGYDVEAKPNKDKSTYGDNDDAAEMIDNGLYTGKNITMVGCGVSTMGNHEHQYSYVSDESTNKYTITHTDEKTSNIIKKATAKSTDNVPKGYRTWVSTKMQDNSKINNKIYLDNIEKEMLKGGNGSRGIFQCRWSHEGRDVGGHSMAYVVEKNQVVIIDAQTNERFKISDFYTNTYKSGFLRTDNLTPTDEIKKKVE